jgi:hypothetical protein
LISSVFEGTYNVIAGEWGYQTVLLADQSLTTTTGSITIELEAGYYDDFVLDFDWITTGSSLTGGSWDLDDPVGSSFGSPFLFNPEDDADGDIGLDCYVTGNSADFDFVNGGTVLLISPDFNVENYMDPHISFQTWFVNIDSSFSASNDFMKVTLNDGATNYIIDTIEGNGTAMFEWVEKTYRIRDFAEPTSDMKVLFEATADESGFELLEVGVDVFQVSEGLSAIDEVPVSDVKINVYPNPFNKQAILEISTENIEEFQGQDLSIGIYDLNGKELLNLAVLNPSQPIVIDGGLLPVGFFVFKLQTESMILGTGKIVVAR